MTPEQKRLYSKNAKCALESAGFEMISVSPEDDYIEAYCPKCRSITVFHQNELDRARCYTCLDRLIHTQSRFVFETKTKEVVRQAGFILEEMNYDEDFIMVSCPICGEFSSYHFSELGDLGCKNCGTSRTIDENGYLLVCPVCRCPRYIGNECPRCGFDELNISFFCDASERDWFQDHVLPYREEYWKRNRHFEIKNRTIVKFNNSWPKVRIPYGIVTIGEEAFRLSDVQFVELPKTIKTIGREAFSWCQSLREVSLPSGITFIGADAFKNSHSLVSISVPSSVMVIERGALKNSNYSQAEVKIESGGRYSMINGCLIDCERKAVVEYLGGPKDISCDELVTALESVERIGNYGLSGLPREIKQIIIPPNVIEIEEAAFFNCVGVERIVIPKSVAKMGKFIFGGRWGEKVAVFCEAEQFPTEWDSKCFDNLFSDECEASVYWNGQWHYRNDIPVPKFT